MEEAQEFATREEVDAALSGLSDAQILKLKEFARWRALAVRSGSRGMDHEDLLQEAFTATIVGARGSGEGRRWNNKKVDIIRHLTEAMRSISDNWKMKAKSKPETTEADLVRDEEGEQQGGLDELPGAQPDPLRHAIGREKLASVLGRFSDDNDAILVLEGRRDDWTREDFVGLGMSTTVYDATLKRIRYQLRRGR